MTGADVYLTGLDVDLGLVWHCKRAFLKSQNGLQFQGTVVVRLLLLVGRPLPGFVGWWFVRLTGRLHL